MTLMTLLNKLQISLADTLEKSQRQMSFVVSIADFHTLGQEMGHHIEQRTGVGVPSNWATMFQGCRILIDPDLEPGEFRMVEDIKPKITSYIVVTEPMRLRPAPPFASEPSR